MARKRIKDELLDHDYDGIQELDNDLPPWWLYMFYFTIIFGFVYLLYYHVFDIGDSPVAAYEKEMQQAAVQYAGGEAGGISATDESLVAFTDADNLARGKEIFLTNCMVCHGASGEGGIGPNMTDEYWIHGGSMKQIVNIINVGVPAKGMISWKPVLNPEQIRQVSSYILSLQGTNPPNSKAPEGEKVSPGEGASG